jgi:hypothetical protein
MAQFRVLDIIPVILAMFSPVPKARLAAFNGKFAKDHAESLAC